MKKVKLRLWTLLTMLWLALIFAHSAMPASLSSTESGKLLSLLQCIFPSLTHHFLRKAAHFIIYAVAGIFLTKTFLLTRRFVLIKPLFAGVLTALADETLQLFVEGRSGELADVWLDFSGIVLGSLIVWLVYIIKRK